MHLKSFDDLGGNCSLLKHWYWRNNIKKPNYSVLLLKLSNCVEQALKSIKSKLTEDLSTTHILFWMFSYYLGCPTLLLFLFRHICFPASFAQQFFWSWLFAIQYVFYKSFSFFCFSSFSHSAIFSSTWASNLYHDCLLPFWHRLSISHFEDELEVYFFHAVFCRSWVSATPGSTGCGSQTDESACRMDPEEWLAFGASLLYRISVSSFAPMQKQ